MKFGLFELIKKLGHWRVSGGWVKVFTQNLPISFIETNIWTKEENI